MQRLIQIAGAAWRLPKLLLVAAWLVWREVWVRVRTIGKP